MRRYLIIFHRIDYDGLCSMAITKKAISEKYPDSIIETLGFNYGDDLPNLDSLIAVYDCIFLVDICLPKEAMKILKSSGKVIWLDHHITQITESESEGYSDIPGLRINGTAACEICWKWFFPNNPIPMAVLYLSHYDTWKHDTFDWDNVILPFQYGLRTIYSLDAAKFYNELDKIFTTADEIIKMGTGILQYLGNSWKGSVKGYAFPVLVDNKYNGICMLTSTFGSSQFESVKNQYDCYVCVNRKGPDYYNISIYVNDRCDFNSGEYMKANYNGGGHAKAAGGSLNLEQFVRLISAGIV